MSDPSPHAPTVLQPSRAHDPTVSAEDQQAHGALTPGRSAGISEDVSQIPSSHTIRIHPGHPYDLIDSLGRRIAAACGLPG
jgi:hypothetical protein